MLAEKFFLVLESLIRGDSTYPDGSTRVISTSPHTGEADRSEIAAAAIMVGAGSTEVSATPLTPFRYEARAQRHCPHDKVVWLDLRKGAYYRRRQKRYDEGFDGSFVCQNEARDSFYRRSLLGRR